MSKFNVVEIAECDKMIVFFERLLFNMDCNICRRETDEEIAMKRCYKKRSDLYKALKAQLLKDAKCVDFVDDDDVFHFLAREKAMFIK